MTLAASIVLFTIMFVGFFSYITFILLKYGVKESVSKTFYSLPPQHRYLFTLYCWSFSVPVMILGGSLLMYLAGAGIMFVGATPAFKDTKITNRFHTIGAAVGITFSQIAIFFDYRLWYLNIIFIVSSALMLLFTKKLKDNHLFWIEILAFLIITYTLVLDIINTFL